MTDIERATNQELLDELLSRSTFVGVVVYVGENYRSRWEQLENVQMIRSPLLVRHGNYATHFLRTAAEAIESKTSDEP